MKPMTRLHTDQRGMVAAITIVLVALLFFAGTVMALAVEANLHTVSQIRDQDAAHYAAESAVARGVATSITSQRDGACGPQQPINGVEISRIECHSFGIDATSPGAVKQWAVPSRNLPFTEDVDLGDLKGSVVLWTVIGSHGAINISMEDCPPQNVPAGANYFSSCPLPIKGRHRSVSLHVAGAGGSVTPFIIRAAQQGSSGVVVTVIGQAKNRAGQAETGQADVFLPKGGGKPVLGLWGTVLP